MSALSVEVENYESDCGLPCTPDGCFGHDSGIPERIIVNDFALTLGDFARGDWPFLDEEGAEIPGEVQRWRDTVNEIVNRLNMTASRKGSWEAVSD